MKNILGYQQSFLVIERRQFGGRINIFGTDIPMPNNLKPNIDLLLQTTFKKDREREVFARFLESSFVDGITVLDKLYAKSEETTEFKDMESIKSEVVGATIKNLKDQRLVSGLTSFDSMVIDLVEANEPNTDFVRRIRSGRVAMSEAPDNFPGMRKRAETLLVAKISSDVRESDVRNYLSQKKLASLVREYSKDLFYAVNHGLGQRTLDYLRLVFELDQLQTSETIPQAGLRRLIADRMLDGRDLELVHVKSLRFTYPGGRNLRILETTDPVLQDGLEGESRAYPSEDVIFERLEKVRNIIETYGIKSRLTVIISDQDLDYCFPEGQTIVNDSDVVEARKSAGRYIKALSQTVPKANVFSLNAFLEGNGSLGKFEELFAGLVREGNAGGGKLMTAKILEMRVNGQYEHYREMFGHYTRELARRTAIHQIANILSLSAVFETFETTPVLIIDSRGFEDQLIGGCNPKSVVKYFTKLKDPVVISKKTES